MMKNKELNDLSAVIRNAAMLTDAANDVIRERTVAESFLALISIFDLYRIGKLPISVNEALGVLTNSHSITERTARMRFQRMIDQELIELLVDVTDRRRRTVSLTEFGSQCLQEINDKYLQKLENFYSTLSASSRYE
jgi:DNA-binding MarR family transcriptional regulator